MRGILLEVTFSEPRSSDMFLKPLGSASLVCAACFPSYWGLSFFRLLSLGFISSFIVLNNNLNPLLRFSKLMPPFSLYLHRLCGGGPFEAQPIEP